GGESNGPAIVPGKPDASALIARITHSDPNQLMPPPKEKKPLKPADLDKLRRWISEGATYAQHWAFVLPVKAPPPKTKLPVDTAVDAFVVAKLEKMGLSFSPEASPETLCRRVYLDVIGLPPSIAELDAFLTACRKQGTAAAMRELVNRLLESEQY